jgi:HK97 family phage prohead protease
MSAVEEAEAFAASHGATTSEPGTFRGLASAYNVVVDNGVTGPVVILPGAFASAVNDFSRVRVLREHDANRIVGKVTKLEDTEEGLIVEGEFVNTPEAQEVRELARSGAMPEMSIGFEVVRFTNGTRDGKRVRLISEGFLRDVSFVAFAANPRARLREAASLKVRGESMSWREQLQEVEDDYAELTGVTPRPATRAPAQECLSGRVFTLAQSVDRESAARAERFARYLGRHPELRHMDTRRLTELIELEHEATGLGAS